jgi:hypothetical protein
MSNQRPSLLLPHKDRIITLFRKGGSMRSISEEFGCCASMVRFLLMQQIPVEYERIQDKRWGSQRVKHRRIKEETAPSGSSYQCTGLGSCTCFRCNLRGARPPEQEDRFNVYRAYASGSARG